jgi:hypothetical protein
VSYKIAFFDQVCIDWSVDIYARRIVSSHESGENCGFQALILDYPVTVTVTVKVSMFAGYDDK